MVGGIRQIGCGNLEDECLFNEDNHITEKAKEERCCLERHLSRKMQPGGCQIIWSCAMLNGNRITKDDKTNKCSKIVII
jgi:hypothetical protein